MNIMVFLKDKTKGSEPDYNCILAIGEYWEYTNLTYTNKEVCTFSEHNTIVVFDRKFLPRDMEIFAK